MVNLSRARRYFALTFNRDQPLDHGERRYQRILQTTLTALASRGIALLVSFISVPLTIHYLGTERYGIWVTISTLLAWLTIADLGLGNGLTNALSDAYGKERSDLAQRYVATTFWLLSGIAFILLVVITILWRWIDWSYIFNIKSALGKAEIPVVMALSIALFLLNFPLSVVPKIYGAYQEGVIANYWAAGGSIASVISLIGVTQTQGGLVWLVLAVSGTQVLVLTLNTMWLFFKHKPWLLPRISLVQRSIVSKLAGIGGMFFVVQAAALILFQTDNLVIAHYLGAEHVTGYNITYRLFSYVGIIQSLYLIPLWPAYTEAAARNEWMWIKRTFNRTLSLSMVILGLLVIVLIITAQRIISVWTSQMVQASYSLVLLMAIWTIMSIWGNNFAYLQNGLGRIRFQAIGGCLMAALNIVLSILWVERFGEIGVIAATIVSYGCITVIGSPIDVYITLHKKMKIYG